MPPDHTPPGRVPPALTESSPSCAMSGSRLFSSQSLREASTPEAPGAVDKRQHSGQRAPRAVTPAPLPLPRLARLPVLPCSTGSASRRAQRCPAALSGMRLGVSRFPHARSAEDSARMCPMRSASGLARPRRLSFHQPLGDRLAVEARDDAIEQTLAYADEGMPLANSHVGRIILADPRRAQRLM